MPLTDACYNTWHNCIGYDGAGKELSFLSRQGWTITYDLQWLYKSLSWWGLIHEIYNCWFPWQFLLCTGTSMLMQQTYKRKCKFLSTLWSLASMTLPFVAFLVTCVNFPELWYLWPEIFSTRPFDSTKLPQHDTPALKPPGRYVAINFSIAFFLSTSCKLTLGACYRTPLMISQHSFR